eukprot:9966885-Ditylum_brightwellii.AAC.1
MGVLDVSCLDGETDMSPSFRQMMCCVPRGRAVVLSGFYGETHSSRCTDEDFGGMSVLDSERLVAEL